MPARLGRFDLLRELGRGTQAVVWLAHDSRLDRDVALKLLDPRTDAVTLGHWLEEARAVSRLTHPNLVPVFEAGEDAGLPYLVFEYVEGPTLALALSHRPRLPPREAVTLMLGVLDGLQAAHEQAVVHRDLKPSNILLGSDGRARVMDFGIAARVVAGDFAVNSDILGRIVGTPGYISPEAARGAAPVPAMDVHAAGLVLGEMLCGQPMLRESDPMRALERVRDEAIELPADAAIDATLHAIVNRALARDLAIRYDSALAFRAALSAWLEPTAAPPPAPAAGHATLDFLLRRMRHKTDFPALSRAVADVQRVAASETESARRLTDEILKDVALTHKLLRVVNTAHYAAASGGGIGTVSRAVALVGFAGIRNMALSLVLLEHMGDKGHAVQLRSEFLRALMAGMLAAELSPRAGTGEEAFLGALFQNLGRLLTEFYFPEEALQIRVLLADPHAPPAARESAAQQVLGIGYLELGAGVARAWGLPDALQRAMQPPQGAVPAVPSTRGIDTAPERLRWLGRSANALVDAWQASSGDAQARALAETAALYAPVLGVGAAEILAATYEARARLIETARALGLQVAEGASSGGVPASGERPVAADAAARSSRANEHSPGATPRLDREGRSTEARLAEALQQARGGNGRLEVNELLHLVLETLYQSLDLRCLVFCLREPGRSRLVGRVGLGPLGNPICAAFRIDPDAAKAGDLFAVVCAKGADLLVADSAAVANRLPAWWRQQVNAPTFLLLPLMHRGAALGLIYADKAQAGTLVLTERELALVRALRDEASRAFGC